MSVINVNDAMINVSVNVKTQYDITMYCTNPIIFGVDKCQR